MLAPAKGCASGKEVRNGDGPTTRLLTTCTDPWIRFACYPHVCYRFGAIHITNMRTLAHGTDTETAVIQYPSPLHAQAMTSGEVSHRLAERERGSSHRTRVIFARLMLAARCARATMSACSYDLTNFLSTLVRCTMFTCFWLATHGMNYQPPRLGSVDASQSRHTSIPHT